MNISKDDNQAFQQVVENTRRVVIKIGSSLLTKDGMLVLKQVQKFVNFANTLRQRGMEVAIVTSGAAAAANLGINGKNPDVAMRQAMASIGQVTLMEVYSAAFARFNIKVGQILFSKYSIKNRLAYLNARNTLVKLFSLGVVPIINENDPLAVDEIRFGENDVLGALTCGLMEADLYIIFSDVDGFYYDYKTEAEKLLRVVRGITAKHRSMAGKAGSKIGTGGMATKLEAAHVNHSFAIPTWLTSGKQKNLEESVLQNFSGTLFLPPARFVNSKQRWIFSNTSPQGTLYIDNGAAKALLSNKSLLAKGIVFVQGKIFAGDVVDVCIGNAENLSKGVVEGKGQAEKDNQATTPIAKGLVNFSANELVKIIGKDSKNFETILGMKCHEEVVHRSNLVLLQQKK